MIIRFVIYGIGGWVAEILWTGMGSILRGDRRLRAQTYLWMFPIYGGGGLLAEFTYRHIAAWPWFGRGMVWITGIFAVEYAAGWLIRKWVGTCPWDYTQARFGIHGLIRLDYAPAWLVLGLLFEQGLLLMQRMAALAPM